MKICELGVGDVLLRRAKDVQLLRPDHFSGGVVVMDMPSSFNYLSRLELSLQGRYLGRYKVRGLLKFLDLSDPATSAKLKQSDCDVSSDDHAVVMRLVDKLSGPVKCAGFVDRSGGRVHVFLDRVPMSALSLTDVTLVEPVLQEYYDWSF